MIFCKLDKTNYSDSTETFWIEENYTYKGYKHKTFFMWGVTKFKN